MGGTYLQLPDNRFAEVLWARVDAESNQKSSVYALFQYAPFPLLCPQDPILLEFAGLALRLGLSPWFQRGITLRGFPSPDA